MTQLFTEAGRVVPVTVLEAGLCKVTQVKTLERDQYEAVQISLGKKKKEFNPINKAEEQLYEQLGQYKEKS